MVTRHVLYDEVTVCNSFCELSILEILIGQGELFSQRCRNTLQTLQVKKREVKVGNFVGKRKSMHVIEVARR